MGQKRNLKLENILNEIKWKSHIYGMQQKYRFQENV